MRKTTFLLIVLLIWSVKLFSDNSMQYIDSLNRLISTQTGVERIETLIALSEAYREISPDESFKLDTLAIDYATREGLDNIQGTILISMGKTAFVTGDYTLALDYYQKAVKILEKGKNFEDLCKAQINIGIVFKNLGKYELAIERFDQAVQLAFQHNLKGQLASSITNRAVVYYTTGNYNSAAESYQQAIQLYKELHDTLRNAILTMNLGLVYWQWNKSDKALEMLLSAAKVFEDKEEIYELGRVYNNIGRIYSIDFQNNSKALEYYQRSLEMRELLGNQLGMAIVLANMGQVFSDQKDYVKALHHYNRSLTISKSIGYKDGEALADLYLGRTYQAIEQFELSNQFLDSCLMIAEEFGLTSYFRPVNLTKMTNYFKMQDYSSFLTEYQSFMDSYDSTLKRLSDLQYSEVSLQQQLSDMEASTGLISNQLLRQTTRINQYRLALAGVVLISGILVIFSYIRKWKS